MKVVGKNEAGKPIKLVKMSLSEIDRDENLPSVWIELGEILYLTGTDDDFKTLISAILRDLDSDKDDPITKHYLEKQPNKAIL